ncbi:MAG: sugar ABC transporter permease [Clostridiales bacterium]|nr:sugar ABC transporter permease [Clostridiales bacterium]
MSQLKAEKKSRLKKDAGHAGADCRPAAASRPVIHLPRLGLVARREIKGYVFLLPWLIGFLLFFALPLVQSVIYSLHSVKMTASGRKMSYVGFENFNYIFTKDTVFTGLITSFYSDTILRLAVILVFSLVIAMMLNQPLRGKGIFRTIFFLPIVVVSGPVLQRLVDEGATTVPLIESYGISAIVSEMLPPMLADPLSSLFSQMILVLWYSGVPILIYLTGLQKIDRSIYEAALIDGAGGWVVFWKITLPSLRSMILINGVYTLVFLATSGLNNVMTEIDNRMFGSAPSGGYGIASAMAWVYTLTLALGLLILFLITRERKRKEVELVKTKEQVRVEKLHAQRAAARKGGRHEKR